MFSAKAETYNNTFMASNLNMSVNMEFSGMTYEHQDTPKAQNRSGDLWCSRNVRDYKIGW